MLSLPILKDESKQSNSNLILNNESSLNKAPYDYFSVKIPKQTIDMLFNSEKDERYLYFLRYGLLRRYEGKGDILYVEIPQIPKNIVIYRKPLTRNKFSEKLYLNKKDLPHIPLLEGEENLKLLSLESNLIIKIEHLISLNNLLFLNLYENKITDIENLQTVPKLKALMLGKNQISRIKNLNYLSDLEVLDLHSNKIKLIENLFSLKKLRILNLANNQLTSFLELMNNRNLEDINLRKNLIVSIPNLSNNFEKLKKINIGKNMISKIDFILEFKKLRRLEELYIEDNPVILLKDAYQKFINLPLKFKDQNLLRQFKNLSENNIQNNNISNVNSNNNTNTNFNNTNNNNPKLKVTNYEDKSTRNNLNMNNSNNDNLRENERNNLLIQIEKEWEMEFRYIVENGFNGYNIKKLKETKMQLCHAEIERDKQLNLFGNALEVLGYSEFYNNTHTIQIQFLNFDLVTQKQNLDNIKKFSHLKSLIFSKNNLYSFYQLIKLEEIKNLEYVTIKNNEIANCGLIKYFLVYRLQNIKFYNNIDITNKDIIMSKKIFEQFDQTISICENENSKKNYNTNYSNKGKNEENGFVKEKTKNNLTDSSQINLNLKFLDFLKKNLSIAIDEMIDL
jgi:hypothetical protein